MLVHKRAELAVSAAVVLGGALIFWFGSRVREGSIPDPLTARGLPRIVGVAMVLGGLVIAAVAFVRARAAESDYIEGDGKDDEEGHPSSALRALGLLAASAVWLFLLPFVGYLIATPLLLAGFMVAMKVESRRAIVAVSVLTPLALWLMFSQVLSVPMPDGFLAGILP